MLRDGVIRILEERIMDPSFAGCQGSMRSGPPADARQSAIDRPFAPSRSPVVKIFLIAAGHVL